MEGPLRIEGCAFSQANSVQPLREGRQASFWRCLLEAQTQLERRHQDQAQRDPRSPLDLRQPPKGIGGDLEL